MILLQLSAAQGPDECMLATAKALQALTRDAARQGINCEIIETEAGKRAGTLRSALVLLNGEHAEPLATSWCGTLQWTCNSPWRQGGGRKNWFIGVARFHQEQTFADNEIHFEATKSSGPGGQHVNKTESAVRATHVASGITVKVQSERSQHANKRLACYLIAYRLEALQQQQHAEQRAQRRLFHHQIERGNPVKIFKGEDFTLVASR